MGKGERKRNKELRVLSRVLQGQPLSTCRVLCSHLSHPGQLNLFPFSCATKSFPSTLKVLCSPAGSVEPRQLQCQPAQTQLPTFQTFLRILVRFRMASSCPKSTGGTRWEITLVCRSAISMSANEIWRSKQFSIGSRILAQISFLIASLITYTQF